jgi:hypothetical protein
VRIISYALLDRACVHHPTRQAEGTETETEGQGWTVALCADCLALAARSGR